jgi:hypothetical protein
MPGKLPSGYGKASTKPAASIERIGLPHPFFLTRFGYSLVGRQRSRYQSGVTTTEHEILSVLVELDSTVARMATAQPKPSLLPLFQRLDLLASQLPPSADPSLRHYLQKKSYEKARLFLQGRDAENQAGNCRHV